MAKNVTPFDLAAYSQLLNPWGAGASVLVREWGAVEYDATLILGSGGTKQASPFDLASYSQLVNKAGTNPARADARGATILGAQREWGALEYNSALIVTSTPKQATPFDLASYSIFINRSLTSWTYRPTLTDIRGSIALLNAKTIAGHGTQIATRADARGATIQGTQREWGALEYDSTLAALTTTPTAEQNAKAVWDYLMASSVVGGSFGMQMGTNFNTVVPQAVWNYLTTLILTSGSIGVLTTGMAIKVDDNQALIISK